MTTDRLDALIDSLLDLDLRAADLDALAALVRADDTAATRLDRAIDAECALRRGGAAAERLAAGVPIAPRPTAASTVHRCGRRIALGASWALTAASLALAANLATRPAAPTLLSPRTAEVAANPGAPAPRVLGELPLVAVGIRRAEDGTLQVLYVRPQIERADVSDIYRLARDEHGRPVPVRAEQFAPAEREAM